MTNILTSQNIEEFLQDDRNIKTKTKNKNKKLQSFYLFLTVKFNKDTDNIIKEHIIEDKNIRNGEATLKGTRITAKDILYIIVEAETLSQNQDWKQYIYEQYPSIQNEEQILAAILYFIKYKTNTLLFIISLFLSKT